LHGASAAVKGSDKKRVSVTLGRLLLLCASCPLAYTSEGYPVPMPESPVPEKATQWYALMWPEGGGCTASMMTAEARNSIIYRGKITKALGPYVDRAQAVVELQRTGWERPDSSSDRWAGNSGCY
jgi:hypothetical protein